MVLELLSGTIQLKKEETDWLDGWVTFSQIIIYVFKKAGHNGWAEKKIFVSSFSKTFYLAVLSN